MRIADRKGHYSEPDSKIDNPEGINIQNKFPTGKDIILPVGII
jgi:hypothetical protein